MGRAVSLRPIATGMVRSRMLLLACAAAAMSCGGRVWTTTAVAPLTSLASTVCIEEALYALPGIDTTRTTVEQPRGLGLTRVTLELPKITDQPYAEVTYSGARARGRVVETVNALGRPLLQTQWSWTREPPDVGERQRVEDTLRELLGAIQQRCDPAYDGTHVEFEHNWRDSPSPQ